MEKLITHFFPDKLPEKGYKQISFLTSDSENIKTGYFFFGFDGSVKLTESALSIEIEKGKIKKLITPEIVLDKEKYLWLDFNGNIWSSDDVLLEENKKLIGPSGIKPVSNMLLIYQSRIKPSIHGIKRRIAFSLKRQETKTVKKHQKKKAALHSKAANTRNKRYA